jgi:predicted phosphodiesterase
VRGNCDTEVDQMVLDFPILADYAYLSFDGLSIFATHGHKFNIDCPPPLKKGEILLCGHTHIPTAIGFGDGNTYINPGSVSIPKDGSEKGYILYEDREFTFCTLDGAIYNNISF